MLLFPTYFIFILYLSKNVLQNGDYIKSFIIIHGSVSNSITQPVATDLHKKEQYQPNIGIKCNRFVTKRMR